uniref:Sodium proton exchanger n=1 Tax=Arabidopsis thaliana TaxID=3702 RepID=Q0WMG0_ARATH|nr:sodium proton exchanger [Arabidopsis thaliana]
MLSFIAETFIFLYVGTDALDFTKWKTSSLRYKVVSIYQLVERLECFVKTIHSILI